MKLLIGGSPCTHWSIAQTKNREIEPSGEGWELFLNYKIALDKFKPAYFLYENNKSMSAAIRAEISKTFGFEPVLINSALVSAQNRQRLYWVGKRNTDGTYSKVDVEQPADRGILLKDILQTAFDNDKAYCLTATYDKAVPEGMIAHRQRTMAVEVVNPTTSNKSHTIDAHMAKLEYNLIPRINSDVRGKQQYDCISEPVCVASRGRNPDNPSDRTAGIPTEQFYEAKTDGKTNTLTSVEKDNRVAEPVQVGRLPRKDGIVTDSKQYRVYDIDGKAVTQCGQGGGLGAKTGLYAVPVPVKEEKIGVFPNEKGELTQCQSKRIYSIDAKGRGLNAGLGGLGVQTGLYALPVNETKCYAVPCEWDENGEPIKAVSCADGKTYPVYAVKGGQITIKDRQYPIRLADGYYIIRKLTVRECMRLQTVPEDYVFPVSDSQAYKLLGNGWTVDVISHIMSHFDGITAEPLTVLSMYDGMSCGQIALNNLGCTIDCYYATEIDKYAIKTTQHNFPQTVQLGDAFQVRNDDWRLSDV